MAGQITAVIAMFAFIAFSANYENVAGSPAIATGFDSVGICIENCAQCKKMFGAWFEGPLCAESCIKFKGKRIPECEDFASISPFLNSF